MLLKESVLFQHIQKLFKNWVFWVLKHISIKMKVRGKWKLFLDPKLIRTIERKIYIFWRFIISNIGLEFHLITSQHNIHPSSYRRLGKFTLHDTSGRCKQSYWRQYMKLSIATNEFWVTYHCCWPYFLAKH